MRKLIKRYQSGGNTGNVGASQLIDIKPIAGLTNLIGSPQLNNTNLQFNQGLQDKLSSIEPSIGHKGNFLGELLKGNNGLYSMAGNVLTSLLPERITSSGIDTVNNVLSMAENIPVYGKFATLAKFGINAIDSLGGSTLDSLNNNQDTQDALSIGGSGYGKLMDDWENTKRYSGKRAGLFSDQKGMNSEIHEANYNVLKLQNIIGNQKANNLLTAQMQDRWNERTMINMNGGPGNISFGRLGLKIEILPKVHAILNAPKVVATLKEFEEIPEFKEGGKMNVIPEGALHARLHHMENADGLTKKGIPVVSISEGGELEQQAEIELNEIIFNLEVTQKLEKLMQDGSDNAAIEAGKLLTKEIFENTDDRTGLIDKLTTRELTPEEAIKQHQVFQKGGSIKTTEELNARFGLYRDEGVIEKINKLSQEQLDKLNEYLNSIEA